MQPVSHQTIKLGRGKHSSPEHGACVMELASMLAGEHFSDNPYSVSPAIAWSLRGYNDTLDDERRQDLYEYAAKVVGTHGTSEAEMERGRRLVAWGDEMWAVRSRRSILDRLRSRSARTRRHSHPEPAARYALASIGKISDERHAVALALVDELIAVGAKADPEAALLRVTGRCEVGAAR